MPLIFTKWKAVVLKLGAQPGLEHLPNQWQRVIASGQSNDKGMLSLDATSNYKLLAAYKRYPGRVYLLYPGHATPLEMAELSDNMDLKLQASMALDALDVSNERNASVDMFQERGQWNDVTNDLEVTNLQQVLDKTKKGAA